MGLSAGRVLGVASSAPDAADRSKGEDLSMGNLDFGWPAVLVAVSAMGLAGCATGSQQQEATPVPLPQPELPARVRPAEIVGRYGYAAFHDAKDRARTEANARGQCKQPFVIG